MSALESDEKHLELKVGAMILIAMVLLITFILLLGDWTLQSQKRVTVYFQNPGGLSPGAAVKVAGRKAGKITEMTFMGQNGPIDPVIQKPSLVKVEVDINQSIFNALRADAKFYITTKGVLGDPFLEIDPGTSPMPHSEKQPIFGVNPPRLDLFLADTYELIRGLNGIIDRNTRNIDLLIGGSAKILGTIDRAMETDGGVDMQRVGTLFDNVDGLVSDTRKLINGAKDIYVDDPNIPKAIHNITTLTQKLKREINPLLADIRGALDSVNRVAGTIGPKEQQQIQSTIAKIDDIATRTDKIVARADHIVARLEHGEGTIGQLLEDDEIYDDLKALIRDIKRHPWKIIWQE
jgi:phospholipid/cholesterol/gamma-HCH transport system substrate-binding protein